MSAVSGNAAAASLGAGTFSFMGPDYASAGFLRESKNLLGRRAAQRASKNYNFLKKEIGAVGTA